MPKDAVVRRLLSATAKMDPSNRTDRDLLVQFVSKRDETAFEALVKRHTNLVLGVCRRTLPNGQDAEDACQAVFLILAKKADSIRWQPSIANWLYSTARKVARASRLAADRRIKREGRGALPKSVSPLDQMTGRELLAALDVELDRLPAIYREPLVLCYLEGLSRNEVAARLGVGSGTIKIRLERGRKKLADALTKRGVVLGAGLLTLASTSTLKAASPKLIKSILAALGGSPSPAVAALMKGVAVNGFLTKATVFVLAVVVAAATGFGFASMPNGPQGQESGIENLDKEKMEKPAAKGETTKPDAKERTFTGKVVGPDGKPIPDVKLFCPYQKNPQPTSADDIGVEEVGKTDAEGRFRVTTNKTATRNYLIAYREGYGVDWIGGDLGVLPSAKNITLRLVNDLPITGRVVNTEGKPIAGVKVTIASIYVPADEKLDNYLEGWLKDLRENLGTPRKRLYMPLDKIAGAVKTAADGTFTLKGAGAERIVHVLFEGAGIARSTPYVITRARFDPKPYNEIILKKEHDNLRVLNRFLGLLGPELTFVAESGVTIEGTVTDSGTGKPLGGCRVSTLTGFGDSVNALTKPDGKYRLEGIPKSKRGYSVMVGLASDSGYLPASSQVADREGFTPIRNDVKLSKGVIVSGRVIDKQTGKGVQAGVRLAPLPGNKFFGATAGSDSYRHDRTMSSTDSEGRFKMPTIPGRALLMVQAQARDSKFNGEYLNPFRRAVPEPDHKDLFKYDPDDDTWTITTVENNVEILGVEHAVKVVDIKETGETVIELSVDRGVLGKVLVQDADGKPLAGAHVAGITHSWPLTYKLPDSSAVVYALDSNKPRMLVGYHAGKKLAGSVTIRGDEKDPVILKLTPTGTITGRFVDESGVALAGAEVSVNASNQVVSELYRFTVRERQLARTDEKGNFVLPDIVPGAKFYLQVRKGEKYYRGKPKFGEQILKAGETKELGERMLEPSR